MTETFDIESARAHHKHVMEVAGAALKDARGRFLKERAEIWLRFRGEPEKHKKFLDNLRELREAKRVQEFYEYTTKPCGCHCDPGGHP